MLDAILAWDTTAFFAANSARSFYMDVFMPIISSIPLLFALIIATFAFSAIGQYRRNKSVRTTLRFLTAGFFFLALCVGANEAVTNVVKKEVGRLRPYQAQPLAYYQEKGVWLRNGPDFTPGVEHGDSFFSGHTSNVTSATVALATVCPPLSPVIYVLPPLVGYSRLYLGRHYPTDVLCGLFSGLFIALFLRRLLWPRLRRWALEEAPSDRT